jgi:hypothetical protein
MDFCLKPYLSTCRLDEQERVGCFMLGKRNRFAVSQHMNVDETNPVHSIATLVQKALFNRRGYFGSSSVLYGVILRFSSTGWLDDEK